MRFCGDCGSYLVKKGEEYWCPRCQRLLQLKAVTEDEAESITEKTSRSEQSDAVYFSDINEDNSVKVARSCPKCGNEEAFRWFSNISGEHAGISRERTVEHYRCTKCSHSWSSSR